MTGRLDDVRVLLERLVAIESVNPTLVPGGSGELELARFVTAWLREHDIDAELVELAADRANVVARVRGTGGGRSLMLNAHLDTVGLGGTTDGLTPRVEGNRLFGRGAYDMKGSLAAIMLVTAEAATRELSGDVVLTAVADEEAESIGMEAVAGTVPADAAIVTEPTEGKLAIAHKGFVWLELETAGKAAHGSRYDLGVDAIAKMGGVLVGVGRLDERLRSGDGLHPLLGGGSLHASLIEGGQELSTYPERCTVKVERRTLPGETTELVEEELRAVAEPSGATVRRLFDRPPLETAPEQPVVAAVARNAEAIRGERPELVGVPYWTDAALLAAAGIPTVVFGPSGEGAHADVEWIDLDDLAVTTEILLATVCDFCA